MPPTIENLDEQTERVSKEQLADAVGQIDWDAHWRKVIEIISDEAAEYEKARARSMEGSAQRVFL